MILFYMNDYFFNYIQENKTSRPNFNYTAWVSNLKLLDS